MTKAVDCEPRLFRLNIEVGSLDRAADFYATLLKQEGRLQMGARCYFAAGDVTLQVVEVPLPHAAAKALYFAVDDLDTVYARIDARLPVCIRSSRSVCG